MRRTCLVFFIVLSSFISKGGVGAYIPDTSGFHELTIYTFAPARDIDWENPSALYKSVLKSYIDKFFHPQKRFLGHMAFRLNSSLLAKPLYVGIISSGSKEMRQQLFKKKIGLGLLGYPFRGEMETEEFLKSSIGYNASKKKLAFVTYRINADAAKRVLKFLEIFSKKFDDRYAPSSFYGGAFWPLYENEGAGCSALCVAALAAGNIDIKDAENWKVKCRIPVSLIGGELNNDHKVKTSVLKKTRKWYEADGTENKDFVDFEIYDPGKMLAWIRKMREAKASAYKPVTDDNIPGLYVDCKNTNVPPGPLLVKREKPNFFLPAYYKKISQNATARK